MSFILPAEWGKQDATLFTWPHKNTDWEPILDKIEPIYLALCKHILSVQALIIVTHDLVLKAHIKSLFRHADLNLSKVHFVITPCNDTWARDHGPITLVSKTNNKQKIKSLDFIFNGWGNKFESALDNKINQAIYKQSLNKNALTQKLNFVLEGGAIETDGKGTLLSTTQCLLNPNRNPALNKQQIEHYLTQSLGVTHFLWLNYGYLAGDDTDSHIDTLVRFAPNDTLVYVSCNDKSDIHFNELSKMKNELKNFRTEKNQAYKLIDLPWPSAKYNNENERLPATYANYLIINNFVLVPTYQDKQDNHALIQIQKAYPEHKIVGIDCLALINQFGSLHCISMQLPCGFLSTQNKELKHEK